MKFKISVKTFVKVMIACVASAIAQVAFAQAEYVGEIGLRGGVAFYNGDINSTKLFRDVQPAAGAFIRFHLTDYINLKIDGGFANLKCDARDYENKFPTETEYDGGGFYTYQFDKRITHVGLTFELNFFKFDMNQHDRDAKRHTPYVLLGPSLAVMSEWSGQECRGGLAFGLGYKFKVGERVNMGLEWTMHKLFRDDLERNAHRYLDDPYKLGGSSIKNNDYYSLCMAFVSIDIFKKKGACREIKRLQRRK